MSTKTVLKTLATCSNVDVSAEYAVQSFDISAYKGQTVRINFVGTENGSNQTSFAIDDVSIVASSSKIGLSHADERSLTSAG